MKTVSREVAEWAHSVRAKEPPTSLAEHLSSCASFFDHYSAIVGEWRKQNAGYHQNIESLTRFYVAPGKRVLEVGSGTGDLLAAVRPSVGVGVDLSPKMVERASSKHPELRFYTSPLEELDLNGETFDYIILSDLVGFLYDIRMAFERLHRFCHRNTRIVISWYSRVWEPALTAAETLGLKYPQPILNWTAPSDIINLLGLTDFEPVSHRSHTLLPLRIPVVSRFVNRYLANLPVLRAFNISNFIVARPLGLPACSAPTVTVVCPCRNEAGNIEQIVRRLPQLGSHTELIFVEGNSRDNTLEECHRVKEVFPETDIKVFKQTGKGKGDAVRLGFSAASGDILMILDADVSVEPEELVYFYNAIASGKGDFINGSRLVYAMDPKAMRFLNLLGNKFFAWLLSTLIGQPLRDSLCGTKVLWRTSYQDLAQGRSYFGDFDPFGDFDLLFGAAKLKLKIVEIPIRYRERVYGETNINRFADGLLLFRMCGVAASKLYFIA